MIRCLERMIDFVSLDEDVMRNEKVVYLDSRVTSSKSKACSYSFVVY